jgi:hypothetical protein
MFPMYYIASADHTQFNKNAADLCLNVSINYKPCSGELLVSAS